MKSRLHLFRWDKGPASREAVRMREALVAARAAGAEGLDLDFGLGLYDYYADTLPRFFKLVAFVLRIPGGDRERGLERVARVARGGSLFHDDEARVQMYDIHSYFERKPDRALHWIREMWRRHPGWPIWGLKLAQLLGEPMGLWAAERRRRAGDPRHRGGGPPARTTSRSWRPWRGCSWRRRSSATCASRRRARRHGRVSGAPATPWVRERAERVLARCATSSAGRALPRRSRSRCSRGRGGCASGATSPPPRRPVGRRSVFPTSDEGRLCAARESLRRGRPEAARELARAVLDGEGTPWLRPSARLVLAQALESEGERARALDLYRRAWEEPLGREALRAEAAEAIRRLEPATTLPDAPPLER